MNINGVNIDKNSRAYIIAELSGNHGQNIEIAKQTIKAAKEAGADAIKLQTYTPDTITIDCDNEYFQIKQGTIWDGTTMYELYKTAYTPWEWHEELFDYAKEIDITIFSSPFDKTAVDLLESLDTPAYKVASAEIMDTELIRYIASKKKPIIFSTGMAYIEEIKEAIDIARTEGNCNVALLKCVSAYPAPMTECNLRTIPNLGDTFNVVPGLSDHTLGITAPIVAVTLGAKIIEKHFILDKSVGGPDASFSLDFEEFKEMVKSIRDAEASIGSISYDLTEKTKLTREHSRSLFIVEDVKCGELLTEKNVRSIRPGYGLAPKHIHHVLGKVAKLDLEKGTPLKWSHFE